MDKTVAFELSPPFAHIKLDDGSLNVLTPSIVDALNACLTQCVDDTSISVLIIEGNEKALSVGLDTEAVLNQDDTAKALLAGMGAVLQTLYLSRLRSIVVAQGHATAAGAMLLLTADRRLGVDGKGKIGLSEVRVGLPVPPLTQQLVRDRIVNSAQLATTALASLCTYPEAQAIGFLDSLHNSREEALSQAQEEAERLAALNEAAYLETKRGMRTQFRELLG